MSEMIYGLRAAKPLCRCHIGERPIRSLTNRVLSIGALNEENGVAISYGLSLAPKSAHQISIDITAIAGRLGLFTEVGDPYELPGDGLTTRHGTWIRVTTPTPRSWNPVRETFGFTPTVTVSLTLGREIGYSPQQDDMVQLAAGLLSDNTRDAVLNFRDGNENILLVQLAERLTLNGNIDFRTPERLALISNPYTLGSLMWVE